MDKQTLEINRNGTAFPIMAMNCPDIEYTYQILSEKGAVVEDLHTLGDEEAKYCLYDLIHHDSSHVRSKFIEHGGMQTLRSYYDKGGDFGIENIDEAIDLIQNHYKHHLDFLGNLPLYHEDNDHIYVHAGLNPNYPNWKVQPERDFMYIKEPFFRSSFHLGKRIIFGHTRTVDIHSSPDIWFCEDKIGIDGGCAYGMQLNGLIFRNGTYTTAHIE